MKLRALERVMRECSPAAVAFSGGVDSSLVAAAAAGAGKGAVAFTVDAGSLPQGELLGARRVARKVGIRHVVLKAARLPAGYYENLGDRCYHCKKTVFSMVSREAEKRGLACVVDGSNADDLADHAWGMKAGRELGVRFPLVEAGIGKREARRLAKMLGVPAWDKPASACLASRIAVGERITGKRLARVDAAERFLRGRFGLRVVRVRSHGDLARVQAGKGELGRILGKGRLSIAAKKLKALGFKHVCVDAEGYVRGR